MNLPEVDANLPRGLDKLQILHFGPDSKGVGGIETVIRTYVEGEWVDMDCGSVATWNKTTTGSRQRFPVLSAGLQLLRNSGRNVRSPLIHVHFSHHGSFVREGLLLVLARGRGMCTVASIHGSAFVSSAKRAPWNRLYRFVLKNAHAISVLNDQTLKAVSEMGLSGRVTLVPNPGPVHTERETATSPGESPPTVVFAGTVGPRKGVDTLLAAWGIVLKELPDANLEIWGPVENEMKELPENNYFQGPVAASYVSSRLNNCRVAVLPSTAEAMPMFVLEAMAAGRPTVVTDVGAMRSQIGMGGMVVATGDPEDLAKALLLYLANPALADEHGGLAKRRFSEMFSASETEKSLHDLYQTAKGHMDSKASKK